MGLKLSLIVVCGVLVSLSLLAQDRKYSIRITGNSEIAPVAGISDTIGFKIKVNEIRNSLVKNGHLLANVDTLHCVGDSCYAVIYAGNKVRWVGLKTEGFSEELLRKSHYKPKYFDGEPVQFIRYSAFISNVLDYAGQNGYPFASVYLDSASFIKDGIVGKLRFEAGPLIEFDTATIKDKGILKPKFLQAYLRVKEGMPFNQVAVRDIEDGIKLLPYCELREPVGVSFANNKCHLSFDIKPVKANKIDALIGFLPKQGTQQGVRVTGFVNLDLQNLFRSGKRLTFIWNQYKAESQKLDITYEHPNLLESPVSVKVQLGLLKEDTTFINRRFRFSGNLTNKKHEYGLTVEYASSRLISTEGEFIDSLLISDYNLQYYGVHYGFSSLDNMLNPIRGWRSSISGEIGGKSIIKNPVLPASVYDSVLLNPIQFKFLAGAEFNQHITGPLVGHLDIQAGKMFTNGNLFLNDLYRLGGITSIRGFNDLEIFASEFLIARVEARLIFNELSRIFLFYDQAFTGNEVNATDDSLSGFGAGLLLDTGNGTLQLIYALGNSQEQSLSLALAKIHIGYIAKF